MTAARCIAVGIILIMIAIVLTRPVHSGSLQFSPAIDSVPAANRAAFCPSDMALSACDAEYLAMELSGELLPPPDLYSQIEDALTDIRTQYPDMRLIAHLPPWHAGKLTVGLTPDAWADIVAGTYSGFDTLDEQYRPTSITRIDALQLLLLEFGQRYNPEALTPMYEALDGVSFAGPDGVVGDGSTVRVALDTATYSFDLKWGGCVSGCIYTYTWEYAIANDGTVTPLNPDASAILQVDDSAQITAGNSITLTFPVGAVLNTTVVTATAAITPQLSADEFLFVGHAARVGALEAADADLTGTESENSEQVRRVTATSRLFQQPFTFTLHYDDTDWQDLGIVDESELNVYALRNGQWTEMFPCADCSFDMDTNMITILTDEIADFALLKRVKWSLHLPMLVQDAVMH